jgi:hypothetical protein
MKKKKTEFSIPEQGFIFWPIGTGDSTTVAVSEKIVLQVDLRHMSCADEEDDPHTPLVDTLVDILPQVDEKPYLSVFVLTHPDEDHCLGFAELFKKIQIGEIWFTPRIFREFSKDLCDDAKAFAKEAERRVKVTIAKKGAVGSGDRVRIIGYDDLLKEEEFKGFPSTLLTIPGNAVTVLDGEDCAGSFRAFVHSPFKDDSEGERNETSLGMQVTLYSGEASGRAILLGDLCYPTVKRIFDQSDDDDLKWNAFLAPHHCSKSVMYWQEEGEKEESLKQDILDLIEKAADTPGYIVASSEPIPSSNNPGDNPPHAKAKARYEEIAPDGFLCTQEHPNEKNPEPILFSLKSKGLVYEASKGKRAESQKNLVGAVGLARGSSEPPKERVGFGKEIR